MKRFVVSIVFILLCLSIFAQDVNGSIQQIGDKKIVHVWGNHYERGYAQGYLLAEETWQIYHNYFFQWVVSSSPTVYSNLMNVMLARFDFNPRYISEANGILDGMESAGINPFNPILNRVIDVDDIMLANAIIDIRALRNELLGNELQLGCASISSWGVSTQADTLLAGNLVISRLMDWDRDSNLLANPILIVHHPAEADEQKWMSFTYPGFMGALSAISQGGSAAFLNVANVSSYQYSTGLKHILFSVRDGIELWDYNQDGAHDGTDIYNSIDDNRHLSGSLIHAVSDSDGERFAGIVENNWWGTALRTQEQNGSIPGDHLAVTNHFRLLYGPICCGRYEAIADSLIANPEMTAKRQLTLLAGAAGWENNMMQIQYSPSTGHILWSNANSTLPAYEAPALSLVADEVFSFVTGNDDPTSVYPLSTIALYPNPLRAGQSLQIKAENGLQNVSIYNLKGQRVRNLPLSGSKNISLETELQGLSRGMYILKASLTDGSSHSKKVLIGY